MRLLRFSYITLAIEKWMSEFYAVGTHIFIFGSLNSLARR